MKNLYFLFVSSLLLIGCGTAVSVKRAGAKQTPIAKAQEVSVYLMKDSIPKGSIFIGSVNVGDSGLTNVYACDYQSVLVDAQVQAAKMGGNMLQVTEVKMPTTFGSNCYRIKTNVYRNENLVAQQVNGDSKRVDHFSNKRYLGDNVDCAYITFYRGKGSYSADSEKVFDGMGNDVATIKSNDYYSYQIKDYGMHRYIADTRGRVWTELQVEKGYEYFMRIKVQNTGTSIFTRLAIMPVDIAEQEIEIIKEYNRSKKK
ncbi:hypothetical protein [Myroides sp. N17-2]|uniref:hypothetical protein n=1 Tax=Myroides sp. N17-2 TaxID=2030799 RepID=UPI000EFD1154|nr:hypothetical protein [Myroides sp. N17-2]